MAALSPGAPGPGLPPPQVAPRARASSPSSPRAKRGAGCRVVVASDKFKGTLSSDEVAAAVGDGVRLVCPDAVVDAVAVADGGEGTLAAAVAAGFELVRRTATGPTGHLVQSGFARRGDTAVVELADVSGLSRLPAGEPAPMTATSRGTGELIAAAIDSGCTRVILGIGGSACTDGGAGLVRALGARLLDGSGWDLAEGGAALARAVSLDLTALRERLAGVQIVVACDVDNPLTGRSGAAATYAPQKGASPAQVQELDTALTHWADLVARAVKRTTRNAPAPMAGRDARDSRGHAPPRETRGHAQARDLRDAHGAGAAGGVGFAAMALLGAELRPGIELVLELVGFHEQLKGADLVITGEGALDEQTLHGKAVAGVAAAARKSGIPVVAVCGTNRLDSGRLRQAGIAAAYALTDLEPDVRKCIADPAPLLRQLGERIAADRLPAFDPPQRPTMTATERGVV
ncbi:glycerate kinase [Kribbella qitaiheensis]|uniref:Glycerate kinase n=1 Tax=Kribbella qitaiheensis TaxID=1544730 RepID=A0A7G6WS44_9ACTN|nr:glycerate kinase [Kribbella qitaiheensis]QNE16809.1 glycerate kinase [Kribbella qitaiheensis]